MTDTTIMITLATKASFVTVELPATIDKGYLSFDRDKLIAWINSTFYANEDMEIFYIKLRSEP